MDAHKIQLLVTTKENFLQCISHKNPEWVPYGGECIAVVGSPVVERPSWQKGFDNFGVHWSFDEHAEGGTYPTPGKHPVADPTEWRDLAQFPDLDALDWDAVKRKSGEIDRDESLVMGFVEMGIFERSYLLLGMEGALVAFLTQKDAMRELAAAIADYKIEVIRRLHNATDLDILWYGDDWGTQLDLFLPPLVWREIIRPETERIYRATKDLNILVNQHSCGKIESIVGDMVEIGADMWNPCQPCNDLKSIKDEYGDRLVLNGGIDSQFVLGKPGVTAEEVDLEVRKRIFDLAPGGGYIAAPSHSVPYLEYVRNAMEKAITRSGREVYRDTNHI